MSAFLIRRVAWVFVTLWLVLSGTFSLAYIVPADPARQMAGPHASAEVIARIKAEHHLDQPLIVQYGYYMGGLVQGDLGHSYRTNEPVTAALARAVPNTAMLAVGASIFQLLFGLPIGLFAALRKRSLADAAAMAVALLGISAPTFLTGLGLLYVFGFQLDLFPLGGRGDGMFGAARSAVLPSLTLGIAGAAYYSRLMRGEYLEIASQDFMRTARAKGLSNRVVVLRHGVRNALIPVITFFGVDLGTMLGGAVVTEKIFAWPGVGRLAIDGVLNQDIPVMLGAVMVASTFIVMANLAVDLLYAVLDPRIRSGG